MRAERGQVQDSTCLRRVAALPRRQWSEDQIAILVQRWTAALRTRTGTQVLRPVQAVALTEVASWRGGWCPLPTGQGKTLLSALIPRVLRNVARPLILVPAHLREKTHREFSEYRAHWVLPPMLRVESYQSLSLVQAADLLRDYKPDCIIADEADYLKNPQAAVTRRVARYLREHWQAGAPIPFVPMTGSITDTSIRDFAHLLSWALPKGSPLPEHHPTLDEWARALDAHVPEHRRLEPGALLLLEPGAEPDARAIFRRRLHATPGVVLYADAEISTPLEIRGHVVDLDEAQETAFRKLRSEWSTPDGIDAQDGKAIWRHARELATGFYSVWVPRPPKDWRTARSYWARRCRRTLSTNHREIDTEKQLLGRCPCTDVPGLTREWRSWIGAFRYPEDDLSTVRITGQEVQAHLARITAQGHRYVDHYPLAALAHEEWTSVEPTFVVNDVPHWISDRTIQWILAWAREAPGLIWTDRPAVGEYLAARGLPYYSNDGIDRRTGRFVEAHRASEGSIVLSRRSNDSGRNLQHEWSRNLIIDLPTGNRAYQQLIARTHRPGQRAERVTVDLLLGSIEDLDAFSKARVRAEYAQAMTGQPAKLLRARIKDVPEPEECPWDGPRWEKSMPPEKGA